MHDCVVMFSGGVESTALLNWCVERGKKPIALHSIWDNPITTANQLHSNITDICDKLDVDLITHKHPKYDHDERSDEYFHSARHWSVACLSALTQFPHIEEYYWGVNSGMMNYADDNKIPSDWPWVPRAWEFQMVFEFYARLMNKNHNYRLYPPLGGMTKFEQWSSIPAEVKPLVNACSLGYPNQCNECDKCIEFNRLTAIGGF